MVSSNVVISTDATSPFTVQPIMGIIWLIAAIAVCVPWCLFRGGATTIWGIFAKKFTNASSAERARLLQASQAWRVSAVVPKILLGPSAAPLVVPDTFNMFDPADLPPRLAEYANMVYSACEDLGNFFGFQDSSVRNQAEHLLILLSNHRRYMTVLPLPMQPPSPIHALHAKVSLLIVIYYAKKSFIENL